MIPDVTHAKYLNGYKLEITLENGKSGIVDFSRYLKRGGVFERFRDIEFFKDF